MNLEYARLISLAVFVGMVPTLLVASFVLSQDLTLRKVVLLGLLGETLLSVVVEIPLAGLVTVGMFLHQFMRYLHLLDRVMHNLPAAMHGQIPPWARDTPNLQVSPMAFHLEKTKRYKAAPPRPGHGRHRMMAA